ncbi:MAG: NAD(P)H-dependent oxidoreductase, partial [Hydrogenophaga sp.]|uniref:NAD(P)H-dependent oxidoreductase n=1 Tax=Hydrogenophaga sp. TaxID=1904254 RepID=UPI0027314AF5
MNILQINASARREGANSTKVANSVVERLKAANPTATLTLRDLAVTPHPVLDEAALGALFTPAEQRTAEQAARVALDDALIAEIQAHDT